MPPAPPAFPSTHPSLLAHVRAANREAWATFFSRYSPVIRNWCRRHRLRPDAADDVSQALLADMPRKLRSYSRDRADGGVNLFRAWLRAVVRHAAVDHARDRARSEPLPADLAGAVELERALTASHDADVRAVVAAVRRKVRPETWAVYEEVHLAGRPAQAAAERHRKSVGAVFVAVNRVNKLLRDEYRRLLSVRSADTEAHPHAIPLPGRVGPAPVPERRAD